MSKRHQSPVLTSADRLLGEADQAQQEAIRKRKQRQAEREESKRQEEEVEVGFHTARRLKLDEINQQTKDHEDGLNALSPRPGHSGRSSSPEEALAEPPRLMMTQEEKREHEEATQLLEAETQRFEAEKEKNAAMSNELRSTQQQIVSRASQWSFVKAKLGLSFLEDNAAELKASVTRKTSTFGLGLGRTMSREKTAPFAVGTGVKLERTNSGGAVSANLSIALREDLDRIQAECATKTVLREAGTKLLLFASDGMYVLAPGAMGMGQVVKAADGFTGDAIAATALPGGGVAVVTSCGLAPKTGHLWEVLPCVANRSQADWGGAIASFPLDKGGVLCIVQDSKLWRIQLRTGVATEVTVVGGMPEGDVVSACGGDLGTVYVATATEIWGDEGSLWEINAASGAKKELARCRDAHWGGTKCMVYHLSQLWVFTGGMVYTLDPAISTVRAREQGLLRVSSEEYTGPPPPPHVLSPASQRRHREEEGDLLEWGEASYWWEQPTLQDLQGATMACSDGASIYAMVPVTIGHDTLWKIQGAGWAGTSGTLQADRVQAQGGGPRTIRALTLVDGVVELPLSGCLDRYRGERLSAEQAGEIFDRFDADGNGVLDEAELRHFWNEAFHTILGSRACAGSVEYREIRDAVDYMTERSRSECDSNNDGVVDREEFMEFMERLGVMVPMETAAPPTAVSSRFYYLEALDSSIMDNDGIAEKTSDAIHDGRMMQNQDTRDVVEACYQRGLKRCEVMIALDFSGENLSAGAESFGGHSLHRLAPGDCPDPNPYQLCLFTALKNFHPLDPRLGSGFDGCPGGGSTRLWGFREHEVFEIKHHDHEGGLFGRYEEGVQEHELVGGTSPAEAIKQAISVVKETRRFSILLLLTTGAILTPF